MYPKFRTATRVIRPVDVFDKNSKLKHGIVCARYKDMENKFGPYPELYAVIWDDEPHKLYMGFLPHGLDRE